MSDEKPVLSVDDKLLKIKALVKKSFTYLQTMEHRLAELEDENRSLTEQIQALNESAGKPRKFRNIRAKPESIAFARYLLDREDFTLQEVEDSGVLSYNRAYGLSQWSQDHFDSFAESKSVTDHYTQGATHPAFAEYVPNFTPKHAE